MGRAHEMPTGRILAFSSSRSGTEGFLASAGLLINRFIGHAARVAFIPFADVTGENEAYGRAVATALENERLDVITIARANAASLLEKADAIMVGGGNTFKLLHDLQQFGLLDIIRNRVMSGCPYVGWSAGSNILAPTIATTNDMPVIEPKSFAALHLFPFQINPHYFNRPIPGFNGETRDDRLSEFVLLNSAVPVVALPEGSYLVWENQRLLYMGADNGYLFQTGVNGKVSKSPVPVDEDLTFLL